MKKFLYSATCVAVLSSSAVADVARVEMGAGAWMQNAEGKISYTESGANGNYISNEDDTTSPYVWLMIKHPVPVIPNLRVEYTEVEDSGLASGRFEDFDIGALQTRFTYDMKQYDIIPYYNILDNTGWMTLDLGLDIKVIDLSYNAAALGAFAGYSDSMMVAAPLIYARTRFEIPASDLAFEADAKYITYDGSTIYDIRAKVDYTLDITPLIQPAIEVGYRAQKFDIDNSSVDAKLDIDFSGFYAGLMVRF